MTNTTPADETILKTDVLGRVKTPAARREELLDEFERSGLTGQKFAELVGLKYQTFATWAQKRRRQRGAYPAVKRPKQLRWLEAVAEPNLGLAPTSGDKSSLVLELPGGVKIEIKDVQQAALAAALLRALAKSC
ncbi:MAG: IS66 family insertion sequence element accessory protein TnpA [Limisphaerales bacterium]